MGVREQRSRLNDQEEEGEVGEAEEEAALQVRELEKVH